MFKLALTNKNSTAPDNVQRGFSAPGSGQQTTGAPWEGGAPQPYIPQVPLQPTKGRRSFFGVAVSGNAQRGFPSPNELQQRPPGSMPNKPPVFGGAIEVYTPYYDRGAAAYVQNFGKLLVNPIGAGIPVNARPSASYGPSAQYINGSIWWTSQAVPTSIGLQGLQGPATLAALLGRMNVQAVVREP